MKELMNPLAALAFSAFLVLALTLSAAACSQSGEDMQADAEQPTGERYLSSDKLAGALYSDEVVGKTIRHRGSGENLGEIRHLILDEDGRIVGVVLTTSSFLGLGGQDIGLAWSQLEHRTLERGADDQESVFYVDIDEDVLRDAPEYERDYRE